MNRTLAFTLFLGLITGAAAQTPKVVEKPAVNAAGTVKVSAQKSAPGSKVNPAQVKVVAVPGTKPAAATPAALAVQPHAVKGSPAKQKSHAATAGNKPTLPVAQSKGAPKVVVTAKHAGVVPPETHKRAESPLVKPVPVASAPGGKNSTDATLKTLAAKPAHVTGKVTVQKKSEMPKVAVNESKPSANEKKPSLKVGAAGRRDPFISPVVNMAAVGSGCSSGKRCLAIDQIALRGVVKSETGMIAVVVNAMDKAYFLRENDPVFNGYVVKITQNSIVFKETFRDRLGKPLTRDVTKTINRPVA